MTLSISLSSESERVLRERAAASGMPPDRYIAQLVEESLKAPRSWREAMAPLQDAFAKSAISADELDRAFERARDEVWKERQRKKAS
jgi:hypothetical protein